MKMIITRDEEAGETVVAFPFRDRPELHTQATLRDKEIEADRTSVTHADYILREVWHQAGVSITQHTALMLAILVKHNNLVSRRAPLVCRFCGREFTGADEYYMFNPGSGASPYYCRNGKACIDREAATGAHAS